MKRLLAPAALLFAAAIFFAACGGSDDGGESSGTPSSSRDAATTVATKRIDGKSVLVDADGNALYTSEQEAGGTVQCTTAACLEFWEPLTINGGQPSGTVAGGALGVLTRPDGATQVTFNGDPVYRFTEDQSGSVNGDGLTDAFDGQEFTWHVITTGDQPSTPPSTSGSGGGIPGY
jgi:predicted lipoprotein with Yx(FWY)xxD motif